MYFRRKPVTLGVLGREDGTAQAPAVRQRGQFNQPAPVPPEQRAADAAMVQQARAAIAATLTPVAQTASGIVYIAPNAASLPEGSKPLGVTPTGEVKFAYPVYTTVSAPNSPIVPAPISTPTIPTPLEIAPSTSTVPTSPNSSTPETVPTAPSLDSSGGSSTNQDLSPSTNVTPSDATTWEDFLAWFRGAPSTVNISTPGVTPVSAGSDAVEVIEESGISVPLVIAIGIGAYLLFRNKGRRT